MKGSEKQIEWAEVMRVKLINVVEDARKKALFLNPTDEEKKDIEENLALALRCINEIGTAEAKK